jgi:hypothetical protein
MDVEEHHVRLELLGCGERRLTILRLADDSKPSDSSSLRAIPRKRWSSSTMRMLATPAWSERPPAFAVRVATLLLRNYGGKALRERLSPLRRSS